MCCAKNRLSVRHLAAILVCAPEASQRICCKMRMSGLCKVEMSAFMDGRGPHGDGANHVEPTRTGPIESVARGKAEASFAGSSSCAAESNRPPVAAHATPDSRVRGCCPGSRTTRPAIDAGQLSVPLAGGSNRKLAARLEQKILARLRQR